MPALPHGAKPTCPSITNGIVQDQDNVKSPTSGSLCVKALNTILTNITPAPRMAQIRTHCSVIKSHFEGLEWEKASLGIPQNVLHSTLTVAWWHPRTLSSSRAPEPGSGFPPGVGWHTELPGTGPLASTKCPPGWPGTCPAAGRGW